MVFYADEGLSAKSLAHPQLQAALTRLHVMLRRRDVDGIVVAELDRLSRKVHDFSGISDADLVQVPDQRDIPTGKM